MVAVDPSGTKGQSDDGDEIGVIVAGKGIDGRAYVLADRTCMLSPDGWGRRAVDAYHGRWSQTPDKVKADRIVAERNFGGAGRARHQNHRADRSLRGSDGQLRQRKAASRTSGPYQNWKIRCA
ncbi:hypothetical protein [Mesorhizobium sp.]|uniref:hypothetical protein n=1 Tax=Mesorhizobium sp. TaxID=1871066 RepID=UPI0011F7440A|nr:hypothetical protein [Mesorhizobium sp.]TIR29656.1 MAG: hypothetical protein E5X35_25775 [Mesorhizobium sp.]TIS26932.1 MAG: hypothetical protein E5X07_08110 [Mesorhizobium sp.]TIS66234.1 MAG: hypothetical protein E5W92_16890 [Mesorhizobium sp.]